MTKMKYTSIAFWIAGLVLLVALVAHQGFAEVGRALALVGWGFLAVSAFYPVYIVADTICWQLLLPAALRPPLRPMVWIRWVCDAINLLLPVAQVGGDWVRARLIAQRGVPEADAGASVVADITAATLTEIVFALSGILLLVRYGGWGHLAGVAIWSTLFFIVLLSAFYVAQHAGLFRRAIYLFEKIAGIDGTKSMRGTAEALDAAIVATYRRRPVFLAACGWRMLGWLLGAGETWAALYFLDHPVTVGQAVMLESISQALRHAAFFVPGALGVQEGGFIVLGGVIGLSPQTALALSLVKRARELLLSLPPLLLWQIGEGRRLMRPLTRLIQPSTQVGERRSS
jgi:putative membrane protein